MQKHNLFDQFFNLAKEVILILCPGKTFDKGKNLLRQNIICVTDDENVKYIFRFDSKNKNIVFSVKIPDGEKEKKKELSWKLGSKSISDIVDEIRQEKLKLQKGADGPFSALSKLKLKN